MISVDEALQIVLKKGKRLLPKKVKLENAPGFVWRRTSSQI